MQIFGDKLSKIFSVSNGFASAQMNILLDRVDRECCYKIQDLVDHSFCKVLVNGFRDAEVKQFIECFNKDIDVGQIKDVAGNNPLLLSCLSKANSFPSYLKYVNKEVEKLLWDNLNIVSKPEKFMELLQKKVGDWATLHFTGNARWRID